MDTTITKQEALALIQQLEEEICETDSRLNTQREAVWELREFVQAMPDAQPEAPQGGGNGV